MTIINMHEAKSTLSKLVEAIVTGQETEIILARNGTPVARLVPIENKRPIRLGLAAGRYPRLDLEAFRAMDAAIQSDFDGES